MTDKQIIIDGVDVSNFCLVCYYDNKTNELVRIEQYNDSDSSMYSDIESYEYGYNAKIVKPEEIIKQLKRKEQECEELKETNNTLTVTREKLLGDLWITEESIKDYKEHYNKQCDKLDKLKEENDSLKRRLQFEFDETLLQYSNELDRIKAENDELKSLLKVRIEDLCDSCGASSMKLMPCKVYEKTLTEIKEIAEKRNYLDYNECLDDILQKISECEGNDE